MMKIRYILIITALFLSFGLKSNAQSFSLKSGFNLSSLYYENNSSDQFQKLKPGFHVGSTLEIPITKLFFFESELLFTTNGVKNMIEEGSSYLKYSENVYYLNIPLKAKLNYDLGKIKIIGFGGPYAGLALSGKAKLEMSVDGIIETSENVNIDFGSDGDRQRFDLGLTFGAGLEYCPLFFEAAYDYGLANISSDSFIIKNRVFRLSVGYKFKKK